MFANLPPELLVNRREMRILGGHTVTSVMYGMGMPPTGRITPGALLKLENFRHCELPILRNSRNAVLWEFILATVGSAVVGYQGSSGRNFATGSVA